MTSVTTNTSYNLYSINEGSAKKAVKGKRKMMRLRLEETRRRDTALEEEMNRKVIGQEQAIKEIVNQINMFDAGQSVSGKLVGSFLFMGPTGVGKTKLVETLAEVLHGSSNNILKINCGEFMLEHEIAKLVGAPPGYLGHKETAPMLSQAKINSVQSENSKISIILLDEIEKAAPSFQKLFLNIMDKAKLRTGDNQDVDLGNVLLFMTSNLGAKEMFEFIRPTLGFNGSTPVQATSKSLIHSKLNKIALNAVKRHFSPEFINRIDHIMTCDRLTREETRKIIDLELNDLQQSLIGKESCNFVVYFTEQVKEKLLNDGISEEYGARHLKRIINKEIRVKICNLINTKQIDYGDTIEVDHCEGQYSFWLTSRILYTSVA